MLIHIPSVKRRLYKEHLPCFVERVEDLQTIPEHVCTHHHSEEVAADSQTVESAPTDEPTRDEANVEEAVEEPIVQAEKAATEAREPSEVQETIIEPEQAVEVQEAVVEPEQALEEEKEGKLTTTREIKSTPAWTHRY